MTDEEARAWFRTQGACHFSIHPSHGDENQKYYFKDSEHCLVGANAKNGVAYGATIEDAIRAGRRALEDSK